MTEDEQIFGTGLFDVRLGLKPSARKLLALIGTIPVIHIWVGRSPLSSKFQQILNVVASRHHDQLFHLFLIIKLRNGETWRLEKNEEIELARFKAPRFMEIKDAPQPPRDCNIGLLINNAVSKFGIERLAHYRAFTFNCQQFVCDILEASSMLTDQLRSWILQDVKNLVPSWAEALANRATDLFAHIKYRIEGEGAQRVQGPKPSRVHRIVWVD